MNEGREELFPRVQQVIVSKVRRGKGVPNDPCRMVTTFHALDGSYLGEWDEYVEVRFDQLVQKKGSES